MDLGSSSAAANARHHKEIEPVEAVGPCRPEALGRGPSRSNILEGPGGAAQAGIDRDALGMAQVDPGLDRGGEGDISGPGDQQVHQAFLDPGGGVHPVVQREFGRVGHPHGQSDRLALLPGNVSQTAAHRPHEVGQEGNVLAFGSRLEEERMATPVQLHSVQVVAPAGFFDRLQVPLAHLGVGVVDRTPTEPLGGTDAEGFPGRPQGMLALLPIPAQEGLKGVRIGNACQ